jgi:transcriptional regulator with XRE-family HTH domain
MSIDYKSIGKRIKRFRMERKLSQEDLGEFISLNPHYISQIENGRRIPSVDTLIMIANALEVSADDLLVDLLTHLNASTVIEAHKLIADCNDNERQILIRVLQFTKNLLREHGI